MLRFANIGINNAASSTFSAMSVFGFVSRRRFSTPKKAQLIDPVCLRPNEVHGITDEDKVRDLSQLKC